jgi:hypothetical protein
MSEIKDTAATYDAMRSEAAKRDIAAAQDGGSQSSEMPASCLGCGRGHGSVNARIACLESEIDRQRRVIMAMKAAVERAIARK